MVLAAGVKVCSARRRMSRIAEAPYVRLSLMLCPPMIRRNSGWKADKPSGLCWIFLNLEEIRVSVRGQGDGQSSRQM